MELKFPKYFMENLQWYRQYGWHFQKATHRRINY